MRIMRPMPSLELLSLAPYVMSELLSPASRGCLSVSPSSSRQITAQHTLQLVAFLAGGVQLQGRESALPAEVDHVARGFPALEVRPGPKHRWARREPIRRQPIARRDARDPDHRDDSEEEQAVRDPAV